MAPVIEGRGLVKRFGDLVAVDGIDFSIEPQECFGFLGPNGAGKTTTVKMITCVSPLTSGTLLVDGKEVGAQGRQIKALLGVVPQENNLDPDLTTLQNLLVYARYFDIPGEVARQQALESLKLFQLLEKKDSRIDALSGGMKRRLIIARGLINQPRILVLDEPTTGLDPQARHLVWQKLRYLKSGGVTLVLSTNNMEEAAQLCDRLVIMHQGRVLVEGRPQDLIGRHAGSSVLELRPLPEEREKVLGGLVQRGLKVEEVADTLYVFSADGPIPEEGLGHGTITRRQATLEDVFLRLTGRALVE